MGKLIGKTVALTVAAFIAISAIVFGALSLACPNVIADMFATLGSYDACVHFRECQYDKTGEYSDLVILVEALDENEDAKRTAKYSELMIDVKSTEFSSYVKDNPKMGDTDYSSKEFFYSKYAIAEFNDGNLDDALTIATKCVKECGYTKSNPFRFMIFEGSDGLSKTQLNNVKNKLNSISFSDANERELKNSDIKELNKLINAKN